MAGCSAWRRGLLRSDLIKGYKYQKGRVQRRQSKALFSGAPCQNKRHWTRTETQEGPSEREDFLFYFILWWGPALLVQKDWSLCPLDIQELSGHGSGQPVLGDLAWVVGQLDKMTSRGSFQPQPFWDCWHKSKVKQKSCIILARGHLAFKDLESCNQGEENKCYTQSRIEKKQLHKVPYKQHAFLL